MSKSSNLKSWNIKLNDKNFSLKGKIKKIEKKLLWIDDISLIWKLKDKAKELKHKILINEQQVRFNLMTILSGSN